MFRGRAHGPLTGHKQMNIVHVNSHSLFKGDDTWLGRFQCLCWDRKFPRSPHSCTCKKLDVGGSGTCIAAESSGVRLLEATAKYFSLSTAVLQNCWGANHTVKQS